MHLRKWVVVLVLSIICLPVHAQTQPSPPPPALFSKNLQEQVNAYFEIANPSQAQDGLTFYPVAGYDGPAVRPFNPNEAHHVAMPSVIVNPDEKLIYCMVGTTLAFTGGIIPQSFLHATLELEHNQVASDDVCKITQDYLLYWKASDPGIHTLRVAFVLGDGVAPIVTRTVRVVVSANAPCSLDALPPTCQTDIRAPITRATVAGFKPAHSMIIINDSGFDLADTQKELAVPASKLPRGGYAISIVSFNADETRFVSMPQFTAVQRDQ